MNILLHTCCAPCASHCILVLQELGHAVTLFFSNANIAPHAEFNKRLHSVEHLAGLTHVPLLVDEPDHAEWLMCVASGFEHEPEKGHRCQRCFRYGLRRTYDAMLTQGFDLFTTTLTVSPHKHTPTIFAVGSELDHQRFLAVDFKKDDGFKKSLQLTAKYGLYRQTTCGCEFN